MLSAAHDLIGLTALRNDPRFAGIDGSGVAVAVIDTGLDWTHPAIAPNYVAGADVVNNSSFPSPIYAHGTHVAGIIGATNPDIGVATAVDLIALQVFQSTSQGPRANDYDILEALQWVLDHRDQYNIVAVNMSLGSGNWTSPFEVPWSPYENIIDTLEAAGVAVVSAAGNDYGEGVYYGFPLANSNAPGIFSTFNVGAVWEASDTPLSQLPGPTATVDLTTGTDRVTSFSQRPPLGVGNAILAPGANINSTLPGNRYDAWPGTSMAAPMVTGAVALVQEAALQFGGRLLTTNEVQRTLIDNADLVYDGDNEDDGIWLYDGDGDGRPDRSETAELPNTNSAYPRLNVYRAVQAVKLMFEQQPNANGDPNGTIQSAIVGPQIGVLQAFSYQGAIGFDQATSVGNKDVDLLSFEMLFDGTIDIELGTSSVLTTDFDSYLRLFNAQGTQIAVDNDSGAGAFSRLTLPLSAGVYYVGVSGFSNTAYNPRVARSGVVGATGNYSISLRSYGLDLNGFAANATPIEFDSNGEFHQLDGLIGYDYGNLVGAHDVDLFQVVVPTNGKLFVDIDTPFGSAYVDSLLRCFSADGAELLGSDDDLAYDTAGWPVEFADVRYPGMVFEHPTDRQTYNGHTSDSFLAIDVFAGERFYLGVSDYFNSQYNLTDQSNRSAIGAGGLYQIKFRYESNDVDGVIDLAPTLSLPLSVDGASIGWDPDPLYGIADVGDSDVDMVRIVPQISGILEVDVASFAIADNPEPFDSEVLVFDANGNFIAWNDDRAFNNPDPHVYLEVTAGVPYYIAVCGWGNLFNPFQLSSGTSSETGWYRLTASVQPLSLRNQLANDNASQGGVIDLTNGVPVWSSLGDDGLFVRGESDVDMYRFTAPGDGTLTITADGMGEFGADTYLRLFSADGAELSYNHDFGASLGSKITFNVQAGQHYLIGVSGAGANPRAYDPITGIGAVPGSLGDYSLLATFAVASSHPWQNPEDRLDVNGDGKVSSIDALVIINSINRVGARSLPIPPTGSEAPPPYLDVNGNDRVSSIDVLQIINYLNTPRSPATAPPSENHSIAPVSTAQLPVNLAVGATHSESENGLDSQRQWSPLVLSQVYQAAVDAAYAHYGVGEATFDVGRAEFPIERLALHKRLRSN